MIALVTRDLDTSARLLSLADAQSRDRVIVVETISELVSLWRDGEMMACIADLDTLQAGGAENLAKLRALSYGTPFFIIYDRIDQTRVRADGFPAVKTWVNRNESLELDRFFVSVLSLLDGDGRADVIPDSVVQYACNIHALTAREEDILRLVCKGLTDKEIAKGTRLAEATVKMHVRNLRQKLDAPNRASAILRVVEVMMSMDDFQRPLRPMFRRPSPAIDSRMMSTGAF